MNLDQNWLNLSNMSATQTYTYKIRSYHTDASGKLFVHQLLNFLQDAAHTHADGYGFGQQQLAQVNLVWVLSRLTIEIENLPKHGENIELSTWVKARRGSISEREFRIMQEDKVLINASSLWVCLSTENFKPVRIPDAYIELMQEQEEYATATGTLKISKKPLDKGEFKHVEARYSDIDMVDHVNNATYVRWAIDELSVKYQLASGLKRLDINYIGQCFLGDSLAVSHTEVGNDELLHLIGNMSTKTPICRLQSKWSNE